MADTFVSSGRPRPTGETGDQMQGIIQLERAVTIAAPVGVVWAVLADSEQLPRWAPVVEEVSIDSSAGDTVGEVRACTARLSGKAGRMVERCVEYTPASRICFLVDDESFGMRKMFNHYGFALNLRARPSGRTEVVLQTHYTPRNTMYRLLNAAVMRRRLRAVCDGLLDGLKQYAEAHVEHDEPVPSARR
jgi:uncharacterized protein YndB with AHSA1/START domain